MSIDFENAFYSSVFIRQRMNKYNNFFLRSSQLIRVEENTTHITGLQQQLSRAIKVSYQ